MILDLVVTLILACYAPGVPRPVPPPPDKVPGRMCGTTMNCW